MKTFKFLGFGLLFSAAIFTSFAQYSTITDKEAGEATDIVETNNVIHVYKYLGISSEAWTSTFDDDEDWVNYVWEPKKTTIKINKTLTAGVPNANFKTSYVQAIDDCLDGGDWWNHRTDSCE